MNNKPLNDKPVNWTIMVYISADDVLANFAIVSLNQFRSAATDVGDKVVALFDPNDGDEKAYRYSFEIKKKDALLSDAREKSEEEEPLSFFEEEEIDAPNMAAPKTLTDFVNWATVDPKTGTLYEPENRNYCLILWGHGTELLLDHDPGINKERYLTPAKLQTALKSTELSKINRLDIVAFDACSMSMIELASALHGCVRYMIASQDEVPDVSFPYGKILETLKGHGEDPKEVCRLIPKIYLQSFRDYRITYRNGVSRNGTQEIMLSSLNLEKIENITGPVSDLARLLLYSVTDEDLSSAIVEARKSSRDFVLGLFVDLFDFCEKMSKRLDKIVFQGKEYSKELENVLAQIRDAIKIPDAPDTGKYVTIANETREGVKDCHGVSIYFPYSVQEDEDQQTRRLLGDNQTGIVNLTLVKGSRDNVKKARAGRILELEADFEQLPFFKGWGAFIKQGWSLALARRFPDKLDLHYSAEMVAQNLSAALDGRNQEIGHLQERNEELTKELKQLALKPTA